MRNVWSKQSQSAIAREDRKLRKQKRGSFLDAISDKNEEREINKRDFNLNLFFLILKNILTKMDA